MKNQYDFCKKLIKTQDIHCNRCINNHQICSICLVEYRQEMKIKRVRKHILYESNLKKNGYSCRSL